MNGGCRDPRIWGPLVVAAGAVLWRGVAPPVERPLTEAHAVALPPLHGLPEPTGAMAYELDADRSSVRSRRTDVPDGEVRTGTCRAGSLSHQDPAQRALDFAIDLGTGELRCRAGLQQQSADPLPGVTRQLWSGAVQHGDRHADVSFELWQVRLPGQPLRLQGQLHLPGATLGQSHAVILGLDLAFRRQRSR